MPDREKVIQALENCICYPKRCQNCPWDVDGEKCSESFSESLEYPHGLVEDALALLKGQEPRVIELSEISPNIYVWLEDRDDGTVFPLKGGVIDPDGDDYFRFDADFGEDFVYYPTRTFGKHWRVWDKCPTPEQMWDTPWEGENETM